MLPTSNAKTFTRTFESKIFPAFSLSSFSLESPVFSESSFIDKFYNQLKIIDKIIFSNIVKSDSIVKVDGSILIVKKEYYKNFPDEMIDAISDYGVERGIAYQFLRMIYGYKVESVQVYNGEICDTSKFCSYKFDINKYKKENINPLSTLWFKYSVVLSDKTVKTAIYSKENELPQKYYVSIKSPSPIVGTEIIATIKNEHTVVFSIPNIFDDTSEYLSLGVIFSKETVSDLEESLCNNCNVFLSQLRIINDSIVLKFDGLNIVNNFFLNRRAAIEQQEGQKDSALFYKIKLEEIAISVESDTDLKTRARALTNKRLKNTENMKSNITEDSLTTMITRAKQVMHGVRNNKAAS